MRYRHRVTGLEVESDKPLGPRYERVHLEEDCWCEAAALEFLSTQTDDGALEEEE